MKKNLFLFLCSLMLALHATDDPALNVHPAPVVLPPHTANRLEVHLDGPAQPTPVMPSPGVAHRLGVPLAIQLAFVRDQFTQTHPDATPEEITQRMQEVEQDFAVHSHEFFVRMTPSPIPPSARR